MNDGRIGVRSLALPHDRLNDLRDPSGEDVTPEHLDRIFCTNVHAYFCTVRAALPHLESGDELRITG